MSPGDLICPRCFVRNVPRAQRCWRCDEPFAAVGSSTVEHASAPAIAAPSGGISAPTVERKHGHLSLFTAVLLALAAAVGAVVFVRGTGFLPERAAGFTLVRSRTLDALGSLGPPVSSRDDMTIIQQRLGIYAHDDGFVEVRVMETDVSEFTTRDLLRAQLVERRTDRWATRTIGGVAYTCGGNGVARWCFWATSSHFGRTSTVGSYPAEPDTSTASLRSLAIAIHDAVTSAVPLTLGQT